MGNRKSPCVLSIDSQGSEDAFRSSYPPRPTTCNQSVTMTHRYVNVPLNASSEGGAGISSDLPPPDRSMSDRLFCTDIHQLQQPVSVHRSMFSYNIELQYVYVAT